jgi:uridine nucleosidase
VFGFTDGPPVHDPLCLAWLTHPHLFKSKRYRVDVEVAGTHTAGTTVVDLWEYRKADLTAMVDPESRESWGRLGKNVLVLEQVDVAAFWSLFLECVERADLESPLNKTP